MTGFWRSWIIVWCWAAGLFGAAVAGGAFESTDGPVRSLFTAFGRWGAPDMTPHLRFATGLLGAVTIGWALTLAAVACAVETVSAAMWRTVTTAVVAWYLVDSGLSIATGFAFNAVSNTLFTAAYLVPILASGVLRGKGIT